MSDTNLTETAYVSRELFEAREAKNQAEVHSELKELDLTLKSKIDTLDAKVDKLNITLNARIDSVEATLSMKMDKVEDRLSTAMEGLIDRFQDMKEHQNKWFTIFGLLFTAAAIIAPVAVAVVQHYLK